MFGLGERRGRGRDEDQSEQRNREVCATGRLEMLPVACLLQTTAGSCWSGGFTSLVSDPRRQQLLGTGQERGFSGAPRPGLLGGKLQAGPPNGSAL